jgi:hypothetical protein
MNASAPISDGKPLPRRLLHFVHMAAPRLPTLSGQRQALDDYVAAMLQVPGKKGRYTGVALESAAPMPPTCCNSHAQRRRRSFPSSAPNRLGSPSRAPAPRGLVRGFSHAGNSKTLTRAFVRRRCVCSLPQML